MPRAEATAEETVVDDRDADVDGSEPTRSPEPVTSEDVTAAESTETPAQRALAVLATFRTHAVRASARVMRVVQALVTAFHVVTSWVSTRGLLGVRPQWWLVLAAGVFLSWRTHYLADQQVMPDTGSYLFHSLMYAGMEPSAALCRAHQFVVDAGAIGKIPCPAQPDPFGESLYASRVLYPWLSIPFVDAYGNPGILAVPLLASIAAAAGLAILLSRQVNDGLAVLLTLGAFASLPMARFSLLGLTEPLVLALEVLVLLCLPWRLARNRLPGRRDPEPIPHRRRWVSVLLVLGRCLAIAALVTAIGLTRQATPVIGAMVGFGWLGSLLAFRRTHGRWSWRTGWTAPLLATAVGVAASVLWSARLGGQFSTTLFVFTKSRTWDEVWERLPATLERSLGLEFTTALTYPVLLFGVGLTVLAVICRPLSMNTFVLVGAAVGVAVLLVASPYPTYLRVESAALPALALAVAGLLDRWWGRRFALAKEFRDARAATADESRSSR